MSKARTLADFISDGSEFADGTISVAEVSGAAPLASPTFTGNVSVGDSVQIRLGDNDDLKLYHDGNHNQIVAANGNIHLTATGDDKDIILYSDDGSGGTTAYINADGSTGEVKLRHYGDLKLLTAADGVDITGDVGADTATIAGKTTTDELDLNALAATISDTAVDIFVYDTRKDSDGGAWRKRTQHTSWYNETLNTSTRGSRKEFPAVAVIVAESTTITIYDGDDPDLPMWMVFSANGSTYSGLRYQARATNAITAVNGILYTANGTTDGVYYADFLKDHTWRIHTSNWYGPVAKTLAGRNEAIPTSEVPVQTRDGLVQFNANDIAVTVLPNAPIDSATGLPVPTIAVATDGGISVIKDDGTVVSDSTIDGITPYVGSVAFWNNETLAVQYGYASTDDFTRIRTFSYPAMTEQYQYRASQDYSGFMGAATNWTESLTNKAAIGSEYGLIALHRADDPSEVTAANQMVAQVASDYNTGWMNGDIKLATLSDTDDTDVTGSELVTNGDFSSATGWTAQSGWSIDTGAGTASCDGTNGAFLYQTSGFPANTKITISFDITSYTSGSVRAGSTGVAPSSSFSSVGSHSVTYTTAANDPAGVEMYSINFVGTIDNVSARIIEEDRSVNGNGLQVFGTVTKNPVATGADLVGYSGFGSATYIEQPYNSDLDFGTGDFCYMSWVQFKTGNSYLLDRDATDGSGARTYINRTGNTDDLINFKGITLTGAYAIPDSVAAQWNHVVCIRQNGIIAIYWNGSLYGTGTNTEDLTNTSAVLGIGTRVTSRSVTTSAEAIALFRVSATVPSPEQIKKIYEDEKVLFQENAQATLYGDSDAVTALAYDDSTELLHVGTSEGRSVFQGLRRVDNTTTAVGATISASNGLVADE